MPIPSASQLYNLDNPVFDVPFRAKGEGMVGREDALEKVRQRLTEGKRTAIGHTAAFQGLGGLGKTQLAVEYAHRYRNEYPEGVIWLNADQEIDHLKEWLEHVSPHSFSQASRLTWLQAYPPYHWGRYKESHQLVQSAFSLLDKSTEVGDKLDKLKADVLNDLGSTFGFLGKYNEALEYHQRALEIRRQLFGEQHPNTADSLHNLGVYYLESGNFEEALNHFEKTLKILLQLHWEQHQDTSDSFIGVIQCMTKLRRFEEASDRLNEYLDRLPEDHERYKELEAFKKIINKGKRNSLHSIPSKKKKKKKR